MSKGYAAVGIQDPKFAENVGSAFRACGCFGAKFLAVSGNRYARHAADTGKEHQRIPLFHVDDLNSIVPWDCKRVAVDIIPGAKNLPTFKHPEKAIYLFAGEDRTLGGDLLDSCDEVVKVDTKYCMNLAAAVNVVLYDRLAKLTKEAQ